MSPDRREVAVGSAASLVKERKSSGAIAATVAAPSSTGIFSEHPVPTKTPVASVPTLGNIAERRESVGGESVESHGEDEDATGKKGLGRIAAINANWLAATNEKAAALAAADATPNPLPPLSSRSNASNVSQLSGLGTKRKRDGGTSGRSAGDDEYDDEHSGNTPRTETDAERKIRLEG